MRTGLTICLFVALVAGTAWAGSDVPRQTDTLPFYANGTYDPAVPSPNDYLEHPLGQWPLRYNELVAYIKAVADASPRVKLGTHGQTYEGRDLFNVIISSEKNISHLDEIRTSLARFADPTNGLSAATVDSLAKNLPAAAWMGYSIHGDELSGVDAATLLVYQLAAGTDPATTRLLDNVVVIVDPTQNPDGRERYMSMVQTYHSEVPNYDAQAMQHGGTWPYGRTNHYLFDLNRDWILARQQETRGKLATLRAWNPQLVVDGHEMEADASFLFSPPTDPINYNTPPNYLKWVKVFGKDQGTAFDERSWTYYTGEWNDQWYPGYGSAWGTYLGAVGILYEMAGVGGAAVRQIDNYLLTYHEAVNKQFTSSLANLKTLTDNRENILRDYRRTREQIVRNGRTDKLSFVFKPDRDEIKMQRFIRSLLDQGIEVQRATAAFTVNATDRSGKTKAGENFPAGTYIVSTAQPSGALARVVLEFDPHLAVDFLKKERKELEKRGETKMYEVSTWSPALAYNLDAYTTNSTIPSSVEPVTELEPSPGQLHNPDAEFAFIIDQVGEKTSLALVRLFEQDLVVRTAEKPFTLEGRNYARGALVVLCRPNPPDLSSRLTEIADQTGVDIYGVNTGYSDQGSLLGADTYHLLARPRVGMLFGNGMDYTACGSLWFVLDQELGMTHSLLSAGDLAWVDLNKFNVLIVPASWGPLASRLGKSGQEKLRSWVEEGGTLICDGSAAAWAVDTADGVSQVRLKRDVLDKLAEYDLAVKRERQAENPSVDTLALWHPEKVSAAKAEEKTVKRDLDELKQDDVWQRRFCPRGVILNALLDEENWLNFGLGKAVPVMIYGDRALMSRPPAQTAARLADKNDLCLSGLLWPEARERWANTAYCTREGRGQGQVILFLDQPDSRAYFYGSRQMWVNAVLYGPGMGTRISSPDNLE